MSQQKRKENQDAIKALGLNPNSKRARRIDSVHRNRNADVKITDPKKHNTTLKDRIW